jgi:hypothetical protein
MDIVLSTLQNGIGFKHVHSTIEEPESYDFELNLEYMKSNTLDLLNLWNQQRYMITGENNINTAATRVTLGPRGREVFNNKTKEVEKNCFGAIEENDALWLLVQFINHVIGTYAEPKLGLQLTKLQEEHVKDIDHIRIGDAFGTFVQDRQELKRHGCYDKIKKLFDCVGHYLKCEIPLLRRRISA